MPGDTNMEKEPFVFISTRWVHNFGNSDSLLVDSLNLSGGDLVHKNNMHVGALVGKEIDLSHFP